MRFACLSAYLSTTTGFSDRLGNKMPGRGIYDTVKQAIQDVVAPQLQELKGEIAGLRGEMSGLRGELRQIEKRMEEGFSAGRNEVNSLRNEMNARLSALDEKFSSRLDYTNKRLEEALEIRERLAALEARVGAHG